MFLKNPSDRCYHCKKALLTEVLRIAQEHGMRYVVVGENADDVHAHRPGRKAAEQMGVRSPLAEAGLTKTDIRALSKTMGLPTFDRPQTACLASRIPYDERITEKKLDQIEEAEKVLRSMGIKQLRVRHHGDIARIEVEAGDIKNMMRKKESIIRSFKKIGFVYITLDLQGFRSGSMNEPLSDR